MHVCWTRGRRLALSSVFCMLWALALNAWSNEENVWITSGSYAVPGILSLAAPGDTPGPAVLMLHGTASQKNEVGDLYRVMADTLADHGIASLRLDFAGSGDSPIDHALFTLSSATADARAGFDYLATHPAIDDEQIIVLGFSQGGLIAQRLALEEHRVSALSTWSTVATNGIGSFAGFFDKYYAQALEQGVAQVEFPWLEKPLAFSLSWFEEIASQQTLQDMQHFKKPILAIAGSADNTVPYQQSLNLVAQSPHAMSQAVILAGANHIFNVLTAAPKSPVLESPDQVDSHTRLIHITLEWISALVAREQTPATY